MESQLILASMSDSRRQLLSSAGISFDVHGSGLDEETYKKQGQKDGLDGKAMSLRLAEAKASIVSKKHADYLTIGADQILDKQGIWFDKPRDYEDARHQLRCLRGCAYVLWTSVCFCLDGRVLWRYTDCSSFRMRQFSDSFLHYYVEKSGRSLLASPGACLLEHYGIQLLEHVEGDYFAILGLPLLPLLRGLRDFGWSFAR